MKRFLLQLLLLSTLFAGVCFAGHSFGWNNVIHPKAWVSIPLLFFITFGAYILMIRQKDPQYFTMFFLVTIVFRMLICAGILGLFIFNGLESPKTFILNFFIVYFSFTGFEIVALVTNLRALSK